MQVSAVASVTVLSAARAGAWTGGRASENPPWRSLSREAGQVLTCFE